MKCHDVCAGMLSRQVSIQRKTRTPDQAGGYITDWEEVSQTRAAIIPLSGNETLFGQQLEARVTHRIVMRYRSFDPAWSILYSGRRFNVRSVIDVEERRRWLEIRAEEGVAN